MAIIRKTDPVGIDLVIDRLQEYLYSTLTVAALPVAWPNYESYHRVYVNDSKRGVIPEVYTSNGDYKEVFNTDDFTVTSFWIAGENREVIDQENIYEANISIVFQVDRLNLLFPSVSHRADEELHRQIQQVLKDNQWGYEVTNFITGIDNVYSEFSTDKVDWDDISFKHVVRFNLTVQYEYDC